MIYNHLQRYEEELRNRGQCRYTSSGKQNLSFEYPGQHHWLELDNNPRQEYLDDFSKQKIIYPETTQGANFMLDNEGFYAEKTCFILLSENPEYLLATFSSSLFEYAYRRFFSSIELGENGYQYNKHAFVLLPVIKPKNISETSVSIIRQHVVEIIKEKDLLKQNEIFKAINEIIFEIYNISKQEAIFIEELKT